MDEVIEPIITVKYTGLLIGGLKLYILNKRKDTYIIVGEKLIQSVYENINTRKVLFKPTHI